MKLLYPLLLWGSSLFAQTPRFTQPLTADVALACPGQSVHLTAAVEDATQAFLLRENGKNWDTLQVLQLSPAAQPIAFQVTADSLPLNVRLFLRAPNADLLGNPHQVSVSNLRFIFHPKDAYQCNGGTVRFTGLAESATAYRWESLDQDTFLPVTETSKFKEVETAQLRVTGIINAHQGLRFRLRATDAFGCVAFSDVATLHVHQLSTGISPTTAANLCEGDSARFYPANVGNAALHFEWHVRHKGSSTWTALRDTARYSGLNERTLLVHSLDTTETSFRLRVGFPAMQYSLNSRDSSVCYMESTRLNYTVQPRPRPPHLPDPLLHCGPGKLTLRTPQPVNWHSNLNAAPFLISSTEFTTDTLTHDSTFYLSTSNASGCTSTKVPFALKIMQRPVLQLPLSSPQCVQETHLRVVHYESIAAPSLIYLHYPGGSIDSVTVSDTLSLPLYSSSNFRYYSKNKFCSSDTLAHQIPLLLPPTIHTTAEELNICLGDTLRKVIAFENAETAYWLHAGKQITNGPALEWIADSSRIFQAQVHGVCGHERKDLLKINVLPSLKLLSQPVSQIACPGTSTVFRVEATGATTYQWTLNGTSVGANQPSIHLKDPGELLCTLSNDGCSISTAPVHLQLHARHAPPNLPPNYQVCDSLPKGYLWYDQDTLSTPHAEQVRFVAHQDHNTCLSIPQAIQVTLQDPFSIQVVGSKDRLCVKGTFNRHASLAVLSNVSAKYLLLSGENNLDSSLTGKFEIYGPGTYTVQASSGACQTSAQISFEAEGVDLKTPVVPEQVFICPGYSLKFPADSLYWWEDGKLLHHGSTSFSLSITEPRIFEVSAGVEREGLFCESERVQVQVVTQKIAFPDLEMYRNSCTEGAKFSSPEAAFIFKDSVALQDLSLSPGFHLLQYRKAEACAADTLLWVPEPQRPQVLVQPRSQYVCEGNLTQFTVDTEAAVQWQVFTENQFIDLPGETGKKLRISPTTTLFHQQSYRALLSNAMCHSYSDTVQIFVNQVKGGDRTVTICDTEPATLALPETVGPTKTLTWYFRSGDSGTFHPLLDSSIYTTHIPPGYYRTKVEFTSGCSISGPTTHLRLHTRPEILGPDQVCLGDTVVVSAKNCIGALRWSDGITSASRSYVVLYGHSLTVACVASACPLPSLPYPSVPVGLPAQIILKKLGKCWGDTVVLKVENCPSTVLWSDGLRGLEREITLHTPLSFRARCEDQPCGWSPPIVLNPQEKLEPGQLSSIENAFCEGYNPGPIQNTPAIGHTSYQWQSLDSAGYWQRINGADAQDYNPPALTHSAWYRRVALGICGSINSNPIQYIITPDPHVQLSVNTTQVCPKDTIEIRSMLHGGSGNCILEYQTYHAGKWVTAYQGEVWTFEAPDVDSLLKIRGKYVCSGNSCNQALSAVLEIPIKANHTQENISVCEGAAIHVPTCRTDATNLWIADRDSTFSISCPSGCGSALHLFTVNVIDRPRAPINRTAYYHINSVLFDIEGDTLIWFTSLHSTEEMASPPSPSQDGKYTYYVSAKNMGCESERTPITFEKVSPLVWTGPIPKIIACKGKSTSYALPLQGATTYLWERKRPTDSAFLPFSSAEELNLSRSGNEESPAGTIFRATVSNGLETWQIKHIEYELNAYTGALATQNLCRGDSLILSLLGHVTGAVSRYLWQTRTGAGAEWQDLDWISSPLQRHSLEDSLNEAQFRCVIYYEGGCNIITDLMTLKVGNKPNPPQDLSLSYCQKSDVEKTIFPIPEGYKLHWLEGKPDISTDQVQTYSLPFIVENTEGCRSEAAHLHVEIKSLPGLPYNTTPPSAIEALQFSAEGQHLRWYSSASSKQGLPYPPRYTNPGRKTHYVSQTVGCESLRLKIESEILPSLQITSQPQNLANCVGNTATFSVRATGPEQVLYQWQIFTFGDYTDLPGQVNQDLRISPVTDSLRVRCRVQSGERTLYSEEANLSIYQILPLPTQIQLCPGDSLQPGLLQIQGQVNTVEWQIQQGSQYLTVLNSSLSEGKYRARVRFANGCIRYTDPFTLEIHPEIGITDYPATCPENSWGKYKLDLVFSIQEEIADSLEVRALEGRHLTAKTKEGCLVSLPPFTPTYLAVPAAVKPYFSLPIFSLLSAEIWAKTEGNWTQMNRLVDTLSRSYAVRGTTSCLSPPGILRASSLPQYFSGNKDSTVHFAEEPVYYREKYYVFTHEGEVLLRANSPIQDGSLETITSSKFQDEGQRILRLTATSAPVQVDWYFSKAEVGAEYQLFGSTLDSGWEYLDKGVLKIAEDSAYVYCSFVHKEDRQYRLIFSPYPQGKLELLSTAPLTLKTSGLEERGDYIVERKDAEGMYAFWRKAEALHIDLDPLGKKNMYRLSHLAHQRYKTPIDSIMVELPQSICEVKGNVLAPGDELHLTMDAVQELLLFTSQGRKNPVQWHMNGKNSYEVSLPPTLLPGIYYLLARQSGGRQCLKKLWIK